MQYVQLEEELLAAACSLHDKLHIALRRHQTWVDEHARWWPGSPSVTAPVPLALPPVRSRAELCGTRVRLEDEWAMLRSMLATG
jgi:hypothetical protein